MIEKIELSFENCESVIIPYNLIEHMSMSGITSHYMKLYNGEFSITRRCEVCYICLNEESNKKEYSYPLIEDDTFLPFERILNCNDIVSIILYHDNGEKEEIYMNFVGCEVNELQKSILTRKGKLLIQVNCDATAIVGERNEK